MNQTRPAPKTPGPFAEKDAGVRSLYAALVRAARAAAPGPVVVDPKKTCVHLNAGKDGSAFAGVHPRKGGLLLTLKSAAPLKGPRIRKVLRPSKRRCYCDLLVETEEELDDELLGWMADSYRMSVPKAG